MKWIIAALAFAAIASPAWAEDFVSGRPGNTDSPIVVPTAHWQIESELASFSHNDDADSDALSVLQTTFRYGVMPNWDAEIIVSPYNRIDAGGADESGFGDVTLRARRQFSGAFGGDAALIGFVTLPTASNNLGADDVEGGIIATGIHALRGDWGLTWTAGLAAVSNGDDYDSDLFGGVAFGHQLNERIGYYIEGFADHTEGETAATIDFGVTYLTTPTTQLDAGIDLGVTDSADDFRLFVGWSRLF